MFIRGKSNRRSIKSRVIKEVVPQEQPLDVADIATQKVEEILAMAPEVISEPEVEEEPLAEEEVVEEPAPFEEAVEFIAEEPVEPIGEAEPAEELIPDLLDKEVK